MLHLKTIGFKAPAVAAAMLAALAIAAPSHAQTVLTSINNTGGSAIFTTNVFTATTLSFTIQNTSAGSLTGIGFALPGDPSGFSITSATNSNFTLSEDVKPQAGAQNFATNFDFALVTGPNFGGGKVAEGIQSGTSGTFTIQGDFSGSIGANAAPTVFARFQGLPNGESDVARGPVRPPSAIPEPGALALVASSLLPLGLVTLRKRRYQN